MSRFLRIMVALTGSCRSCFGGCVFNTFLGLEIIEVFQALPHSCQEVALCVSMYLRL